MKKTFTKSEVIRFLRWVSENYSTDCANGDFVRYGWSSFAGEDSKDVLKRFLEQDKKPKSNNTSKKDTNPKDLVGRKATLNKVALWDFPDLTGKTVTILSVEDSMCTVEVDGKEYGHKLGWKGELLLVK